MQNQPTETNWKPLYTIGAIAALVQFTAILAYTVALALLGPKPSSAKNISQYNRQTGWQLYCEAISYSYFWSAHIWARFRRCTWP